MELGNRLCRKTKEIQIWKTIDRNPNLGLNIYRNQKRGLMSLLCALSCKDGKRVEIAEMKILDKIAQTTPIRRHIAMCAKTA